MKLSPTDWASAHSADAWRELQETQLRRYIRNILYPHSPYYRRLFDENKINPARIQSIADLRSIPFTSKKDLLPTPDKPTKYRDFILTPDQKELKRKPSVIFRALLDGRDTVQRELEREFRPIFLTATTGRSSDPVAFTYTHHDLNNLLDCGNRLIQTFGNNTSDRGINIFPFAPHLAFWQVAFAGIEFGMMLVHTGGGKALGTPAIIAMIDKIKPQSLQGMPTYLYHLLHEGLAQKKRWDHITSLVLGGEAVPAGMRRKLIQLLEQMGAGDVHIIGTYGFTEAKYAWPECPAPADSPSGFHLYPDKEVIEIINPDTGEPVSDEQEGEIVYSSIDGRGSVVFRYRTGDYTEGGVTWKPCPHCGRRCPRLLGPIGRRSNIKDLQINKLKGTLVNFNDLEHILDDDAQVAEWQLEIRKQNDDPLEVDELVVHLCPTERTDVEPLKARVAEKFQQTTELRPSRIEIHSFDEMRKRLGLDTALKQIRILDSRPKS